MSLSQTWRAIVASFTVAVGIAIVWGFGLGWASSLVGSFFTSSMTREYINVTIDGVVLVAQQKDNNYRAIDYRTLEGTRHEMSDSDSMGRARLSGPRRKPGLMETPIGWRERLAGVGNWSRPLQSWYLVRDDQRPGRACFEVFHNGSKQRVGFYGRKGWREIEPPSSEWFDVGERTMNWSRMPIASTQYVHLGEHVWDNGVATDEGVLKRWRVYVTDGDEVLEIDLRKLTHRTVSTAEGLLDVGTLTVPSTGVSFEKAVAGESAANVATPPPPVEDVPNGALGSVFVPAGGGVGGFGAPAALSASETRPHRVHRLVIRTAGQLRVINPEDGTEWSFALPDVVGDSGFDAYVFGDDFAILNVDRGAWGGGPLREVFWIDSAGETLRSERLELAGYQSPSVQQQAWLAAPAAPVPALAAVLTLLAPLAAIQEHRASSYAEGLREVLAVATPPLVAVVLLGALFGVYAAWRHREHRRTHVALWSVFVGLLGPAGLIAYFAYWRRQPVGVCSLCGESSPRDRDTCAACGTEWSAPAPLGTEVFDPSGQLEVA